MLKIRERANKRRVKDCSNLHLSRVRRFAGFKGRVKNNTTHSRICPSLPREYPLEEASCQVRERGWSRTPVPSLARVLLTIRETAPTIVILGLVAFEISVLAVLVFFPYLPDPGLSNLNTDVYVLLAPLSTLFLLGLLYTWLAKLGTKAAARRSVSFKSFLQFLSVPFRNLISSVRTVSLSDSARTFKILSQPKLMLAVSLFISSLLALVPYRRDLNPSGTLVGIDSPTYVTWINQMLQRPLLQALQYSFV